MNNKKIAIVGVLSVIVTMMVGYALFSETVTINGTATAKGDFAIETSCETGLSSDAVAALNLFEGTSDLTSNSFQSGYEDGECKVNGTNVTLSTTLKYPGASRYNTITFTNTGSIDAIINVDDILKLEQTVKVYDNKTETLFKTYTNSEVSGLNEYAYFVGDGDGSIVLAKTTTGYGVLDEITDESGNTYGRLKPGEKLIVAILASWNEGSTDKEHYSVATATSTFPFAQIKSGMTN